MSLLAKTLSNIKVNNGELDDELWVIDSIINANAAPPPLSTARIYKVPEVMRETYDYEKYYVSKVVSIGPHHFGNQKLELVEKLKPVFTMNLLSTKETIRCLYKKLGEPEMVQELRSFYEENLTTKFCNKVFIKMMLLDSCFILYYILYIFGGKPGSCPELNNQQILFAHQDLLLLENQIPFKVLREVMKLMNIDCDIKLKPFIYDNILAYRKPKQKWLYVFGSYCREEQQMHLVDNEPNHLLHLLHRTLTKKGFISSQVTLSLAHIEFFKGNWWFSANIELPPITVDDSTKPILLNLIAYEMCSPEACDAWVTSYICLLDSLIDQPEDVRVLRKAGVLENALGSDKEVAKLFNEIGTDLVPNNLAYLEAKNKIQRHYESWSNTLFSQLKHEYVKSPWAFFALLGALIALFLSGVQVYFTVWSPKSECDDLCMFLKMNHRL